MSEHKRSRVLKNIAGCLVLVLALHYVLDEPTRSALIRAVSRSRHYPVHHTPTPDRQLDVVPHDVGWLHDASFERWNLQSYPTLERRFSSVTIGVSEVVKQETEIVQHGQSAVRLEHDGVGHTGNVQQELPAEYIPSVQGRRLKFSAWALSATPGAPCLHITINDDVDSKTCLERPSGTWQPVTVEHTIGPDATRVELLIDISREVMGETVGWVYVDNTALTTYLPSSEVPGATAVTAPPPPPLSEQR